MYRSSEFVAINPEVGQLIAKAIVVPSLGGTTVIMGDGRRFFVLLNNKLRTVAGTTADITKPSIRDHGHTLALGDYEIAADWIISECLELGAQT